MATVTFVPAPIVDATFLIVRYVPADGRSFMINVSGCSALLTNKYFPHTLESSIRLVEIVETHPLNVAHPITFRSFPMTIGDELFVLIVICGDVIDNPVPA